MCDRLLALASAASAVEYTTPGRWAERDDAVGIRSGGRFAHAVGETSRATTRSSRTELIPDQSRASPRDIERLGATIHLEAMGVDLHGKSWTDHSEWTDVMARRDMRKVDGGQIADEATATVSGPVVLPHKTMRAWTEPDGDHEADAGGSNKRRREGEGAAEVQTEADGRSRKKRHSSAQVASGKRDRILRELCPRCDELCLLPKTLACDGCFRPEGGNYPCFFTVASIDTAATVRRTMPPGSHAKPRGRPRGLGKKKCMSCKTNPCSHSEAGPPMHCAGTSTPLADYLLAWTAAVADIRARKPRSDTLSILISAGATAWGAIWDWTKEDWGLQGAETLLPLWAIDDEEDIKAIELDRPPRTALSVGARETPCGEVHISTDISAGRRDDTLGTHESSPPPAAASLSPSPPPPKTPPLVTTARTSLSPISGSFHPVDPPLQDRRAFSLDRDAQTTLSASKDTVPGRGSSPLRPITPIEPRLSSSPAPLAAPSAFTPPAVAAGPDLPYAECLPDEVPSTGGEPDLDRAVRLLLAEQPLDLPTADAVRLNLQTLLLDRRGASPPGSGHREPRWEYPPQSATDPPSDSPEAVLRLYAKTCLSTMDPDSLRWAPRLPAFRRSLPRSVTTPEPGCMTDAIGSLAREKVYSKEYSLDLVHTFLHVVGGVYDGRMPEATEERHTPRLWVDGSIIHVAGAGAGEDTPRHVHGRRTAYGYSSARSAGEMGTSFFLFLLRDAEQHRPWVLCLVKAVGTTSTTVPLDLSSDCGSGRSTRVTDVRFVVGQSRTRQDFEWTQSVLARVQSRVAALSNRPTTTSDAKVKTACLPKRYFRTGPIVIDILLRLVSFWINAPSGPYGPFGKDDDVSLAADLVARFDEMDGTILLPNVQAKGNLPSRLNAAEHRSHELGMQSQQFRAIYTLVERVQKVLNGIRDHLAESRLSRDAADIESHVELREQSMHSCMT